MPPLEERAAVRRLYDRFGWGARRSDVDDGVQRGFDACLDRLLAPTVDDPGAAATPPPSVDLGEQPDDGSDARKAYNEQRSERQRAMALWWLDRMSAVQAPTREKLTWFWHGHFATSQDKVNRPALMMRQNATLRERALGRFGDLTRAMIADPALIHWLAATSTARASRTRTSAVNCSSCSPSAWGTTARTTSRSPLAR